MRTDKFDQKAEHSDEIRNEFCGRAHGNNKMEQKRSADKELSEWISISVGDVAVTDMQAMHYGHVKWPAAVFAGVLGGDGY